MWVANQGDNSLTVLNAAGTKQDAILKGKTYQFYLPVEPQVVGDTVWVANVRSVTLVNARTLSGRVLRSTKFGFDYPIAMAVADGHVFVLSQRVVTELTTSGALVRILSGSTWSLGSYEQDLCTANGDVWILSGAVQVPGPRWLTEISGKTLSVIRTVHDSVWSRSQASNIACDSSHIWVSNSFTDSVTEVGAKTGAILDTIDSKAGDLRDPEQLASNGRQLWITTSGPRYPVTGVDISTMAPIRSIATTTQWVPGVILRGKIGWITTYPGLVEFYVATGVVIRTLT